MDDPLPLEIPHCPSQSAWLSNSTVPLFHTDDDPFNFTAQAALLNISLPCYDPTELPAPHLFHRVVDLLNMYITPVIITVGTSGNLLSFLVFTGTHLRRQSSSVYLASLALADLGFLLALTIVWLDWIQVPLMRSSGWCEFVMYVRHVCTFLSVWYVVSFTVERYIIVWYPLRKDRLCTCKRARLVVIVLAVCAIAAYSCIIWTTGVAYFFGKPFCTHLPQYYHFHTAIFGVDFAVTFAIPSIMVISLNIRIIIKIMSVQRRRRPVVRQVNYATRRTVDEPVAEQQRCCVEDNGQESSRIVHVKFSNQQHSANNNLSSSERANTPSTGHEGNVHRKHERQCRERTCTREEHSRTDHEEPLKVEDPLTNVDKTPSRLFSRTERLSLGSSSVLLRTHACVHVRNFQQYKTARMLIVVSTVFVLLKMPTWVFSIYAFLVSSLNNGHDPNLHSVHSAHVLKLCQLVYHLNFAINFFIYSACGRQFRTGLRIIGGRLSHKFRKARAFFETKKDLNRCNKADLM